MRMARVILPVGFALIGSFLAAAQQPLPVTALAKMPVKEVTIFKDGHAFLLHQGAMPVDESGNIAMDYLPTPVLGTFWAYSADRNVGVAGLTAGQRRVRVERTAFQLVDLIESNIGAEVIVTEKPGAARESPSYAATIIGAPRRAADGRSTPGDIVLLRTSEGVKAMPFDRIQDIIFRSTPKTTVSEEESRNLLTLKLDWKDRAPARNADVGLVYLQKGLRWIPNYRVTIDGKGAANVKLQATLINEITDLTNVTANLVVGVPSFAFKDTLDPLALQPSVALSGYFQTTDRSALSNALMSQASIGPRPSAAPAPVDLGPVDSGQTEDLYLFTLRNFSLNKNQRMSVPVAEQNLSYKDIYTLDMPFGPPAEIQAMSGGRGNLPADQQAELARLLGPPKPVHKIRLKNSSNVPLTTATALVSENDRLLAQGMMTYTPAGGTVDLDATKAVDIQVTRSETETGRTPNVTRINNETLSRVEMSGQVRLANYRKEAVEVEVVREILGEAGEANNNGQIQRLNVLESDRPAWWRFYNWPGWWSQANGFGRIVWRVTIAPGATVDLNYTWRYLWR